MWRVYFLTFTQPQFLSLLKVLQVLAYNTYTKKKNLLLVLPFQCYACQG